MTTDPLLSFLKVDREMERDLGIILRRMASAAEADIRALEQRTNFSSKVELERKRLILASIRQREAAAWEAIGHTVSGAKAKAASAAVGSTQSYVDSFTKPRLSAAQQTAMRESIAAEAQRNVEVAIERELHSKITLSQQVYKTRELANGQVDRLVTNALGKGSNAREIAKEVSAFIKPNVPGGMSYAAERLGRTEINNAFHATQISYAKQSPFIIGMKWNLSGSHKRPDQCNDYADSEPFPPSKVPRKPHPMCLCYLVPETISDDEFIKKFTAGDYDTYLDGLL